MERHRIEVRAPLADVYAAARRLDMSRARLSRPLMRLRGIGSATPVCFTLDDFLRMRFALLAERPNEELLIGLAGRFWSLSGGLRATDADTFRAFDEPGSARAAWNFTRVQCIDTAARRRFRVYWTIVRPFSGLIRRNVLRELKRQAEASTTLPI